MTRLRHRNLICRWLGSGLLLPLLLCVACSNRSKPETQTAPSSLHRDANVLLITIDTLRADHVGCYGSKTVPTPTIDALARRGTRFAKAFTQVPLTTPSHAGILTGTYPQVHKLRDNGGFVLDDSVPTLASVTQGAHFETAAMVGASVLHHQYGLSRGFETYLDDMRAPRRGG